MKEKILDAEECVLCGAYTEVDTNLAVESRPNYIVGCGQLCEDCYKELSKK